MKHRKVAEDALTLVMSKLNLTATANGLSMHEPHIKNGTNSELENKRVIPHRNSIGAWMVIIVLPVLLIASCVIGYLGWTLGDADVSTSGYVAMVLGVIFSLAVGIGLMALVFYSSRGGYDEPAKLVVEPNLDQNEIQRSSGTDKDSASGRASAQILSRANPID